LASSIAGPRCWSLSAATRYIPCLSRIVWPISGARTRVAVSVAKRKNSIGELDETKDFRTVLTKRCALMDYLFREQGRRRTNPRSSNTNPTKGLVGSGAAGNRRDRRSPRQRIWPCLTADLCQDIGKGHWGMIVVMMIVSELAFERPTNSFPTTRLAIFRAKTVARAREGAHGRSGLSKPSQRDCTETKFRGGFAGETDANPNILPSRCPGLCKDLKSSYFSKAVHTNRFVSCTDRTFMFSRDRDWPRGGNGF